MNAIFGTPPTDAEQGMSDLDDWAKNANQDTLVEMFMRSNKPLLEKSTKDIVKAALDEYGVKQEDQDKVLIFRQELCGGNYLKNGGTYDISPTTSLGKIPLIAGDTGGGIDCTRVLS